MISTTISTTVEDKDELLDHLLEVITLCHEPLCALIVAGECTTEPSHFCDEIKEAILNAHEACAEVLDAEE